MRKLLGTLLSVLAPALALGADWFPVTVISDGHKTSYVPLTQVSRPWRICVLLPNGIDKFWWGPGWGLNEDARKLNLKMGVYDAGGYDRIEQQRAQFSNCRARKADAILVAAVQPDGLNAQITAAIAEGVVVVGMINRIQGIETTAHSASDASLLGKIAGNYLIDSAAGRSVTVAWLPGPKNADWVLAAQKGALPTLNRSTVQVVQGGNGLPDIGSQMTLVRNVLAKASPDYLLANAPAAEAAARFLDSAPTTQPKTPKIIAYYANEPVFRFIQQGRILAAASNSPVVQAHIALDLALRALEQVSYARDVQVIPEIIDARNAAKYDTDKLFPPANTWIGLRAMPD